MNFYLLALTFIALSTVGSLIRVVIGPTMWDRLLGIGLGASKITLAIILLSFVQNQDFILDVALLFSLLGFLVTVLLARFVERQGVL